MTTYKKQNVPYRVMSYMLVRRKGVAAEPLRNAFVEASDTWVRSDLGGGQCYIAPRDAVTQATVVEVFNFDGPCSLLKRSSDEYRTSKHAQFWPTLQTSNVSEGAQLAAALCVRRCLYFWGPAQVATNVTRSQSD